MTCWKEFRRDFARAQYPRPRDRAAYSARAASRGRKSDCVAPQRSPHRREYRAHSASLRAGDAEQFIASANRQDGEATFMIFAATS